MLSAMVVTARREEMEGADGHDPLGVNMLSRDKRLNDAALASPKKSASNTEVLAHICRACKYNA